MGIVFEVEGNMGKLSWGEACGVVERVEVVPTGLGTVVGED